jgi:ribose-phosphate pyrophosphokinase
MDVHCFEDSAPTGRRLARVLGAPLRRVSIHAFPDGESLVRVRPGAARHAVLVRLLHAPNAKIFEVLLAGDALRHAGYRHVTLVAPYLPYLRQDAVFHPGEPISQRVLGDCLGNVFDRVLTVEAHLHRISRLAEAIPCDARSIPAAPLLSRWFRSRRRRALVVGPDAESEPWVGAVAESAGLPWVVCRKERLSDRRVRVHAPPLPQERRAILVDDVASSGVTLAAAARALRRGGIEHVEALVVHAIFAPGALRRIRAASIERVLSCDSVPHETNRIALAPLIAAALTRPRARRHA